MAVAAVAQRAAIEDAEAGVGVPAAALDEVAAVGEARVRLLRRAEQLVRQREQLGVAAGVRVGERRDPAVRAVAVTRERAGAREPRLEPLREREPEAARVRAHAEERAQGDHVVVRRGLAVNAVGAEVLLQVAVELGQREAAQAAVTVEAGHGERGDQQRVELERAVVALGRQRRSHVARLCGDARPRAAHRARPRRSPAMRRSS